MNKIHLLVFAFIISSAHTSFGMDTAPSFAFETWHPACACRRDGGLASVYFHNIGDMYKELLSSGHLSHGSAHKNTLPFNTEIENPCTLTISKEYNSYGLYEHDSNKKIQSQSFLLNCKQIETIESEQKNRYTIIWHHGKQYNIRKIEITPLSLDEQNKMNSEQKELMEKEISRLTLIQNRLLQELGKSMDEVKKAKEKAATVHDDYEATSIRNQILLDDLYLAKSSSDQHDRQQKRDIIFYKRALVVSLLIIVYIYFDLASKIMSSFATSTQ